MQLNSYIKSAKLLQYFSIFIYIFKEDSLFCIKKSTILVKILINIFIKVLINKNIYLVYV